VFASGMLTQVELPMMSTNLLGLLHLPTVSIEHLGIEGHPFLKNVRDCLISAFLQVKAIGKFKETNRTEGISTSDIIMRILKDYNQYIMRNLTRGYSRKDLGVSYVKVICSSMKSCFRRQEKE